MVMDWKTQYCHNINYFHIGLLIHCNNNQSNSRFCSRNYQANGKCILIYNGFRTTNTTLETVEKIIVFILSDIKT